MPDIPDLDQWSYLDHRIGELGDTPSGWLAPGWLPPSAHRRLAAYRYYDSLVKNASRHYRDDDLLRELGDPRLVVTRTATGVLGDTITLTVDGADLEPPTVPPEPAEIPDGLDPASAAAAGRVHADDHTRALAAWENDWDTYRRAKATQDWLRTWAGRNQFDAKLHELFHEAVVPLGDGIVVVDQQAGEPSLTIFPPDAYHPVLDGLDDGAFPETVHLAWSYLDDTGGEWVRRITWRLVDWEPWTPAYSDDPSVRMCVKSDGTWPIDALGDRTIDDLADDKATWTLNTDSQEIRDLPLWVDHIPVVHVPLGFATLTHYGTSVLAPGVQVLEQIGQNDTDIAKAAQIAGTPMVHVAGAVQSPSEITVEAGTAVTGGDRMTVMDLSGSVTALLGYEERLQERLERVFSIPPGLMGRQSTENMSGISKKISNFTYDQLIANLRLAVAPKMGLLVKFILRAALAGGTDRFEQVTPGAVRFGAYLPSDLSDTISEVKDLLGAQAISTETGLRMLVGSGLPVGDIPAEVARILAGDTRGAVEVADATGSEQAAADRLGIELDTTEPQIELPEV